MNCPGHMLLFGSQLRSYRDLPMRYAESATLHRNELAGTLHGLPACGHVTQDDAHIFCTREQIEQEIDGCLDYCGVPLRDVRHGAARFELSTRPDNKLGTGRGVGLHRGRAPVGARAARDRVLRRRGRGRVLRAEDRPPHERRRWAARGRWGRSSSTRRCRSSSGSRTWAPTTTSTRRSSSIARFFGSLERFMGILIEHYARCVPRVAGARAGARRPGRRGASRRRPHELVRRAAGRRRPGRGGRARRDARQADPRRGAAEGAVRRRLGRPRVARGDGRAEARGRGSLDDVARRARRRRSPSSRPRGSPGSRELWRVPGCMRSRFLATLSLCKAGAASPLTSPAERRARFNRVGSDEGMPPLHAVAFQRMRRIDSAW